MPTSSVSQRTSLPTGVALDGGPSLRYYFAVWNRTIAIDILIGCNGLAHVLFGRLKALAQKKAQHRLRCAASELGKFRNATLLPGSQRQGSHI